MNHALAGAGRGRGGPRWDREVEPHRRTVQRIGEFLTELGKPTEALIPVVELTTGTALWHTDGSAPLPLRWVLVRNMPGHRPPLALCCTDPTTAAEHVVAQYVERRHIETTFEEVRAQLGLETQREWSTRAVGRAVPCVLGLFRVVALLAQVLHPKDLPTRRAAWYPKDEAMFINALAAIRRHLWASRHQPPLDAAVSPATSTLRTFDLLIEAACYAA